MIRQTCSIIFAIEPGEPLLEVLVASVDNSSPWNGFNSNWDIISVRNDSHYYEPFTGNTYITFTFFLKRRSQYFVMNLFGPVIFLTLLEFFAFFISPQQIERSLYSATIMLAMFVLQDQILSYLPQTPKPIVVAYYVIMVMGFGTFCTFYAAFMFWIISKSKFLHKPVTKWKFKLYNVIDTVCFVVLMFGVCIVNAYCWLNTDN